MCLLSSEAQQRCQDSNFEANGCSIWSQLAQPQHEDFSGAQQKGQQKAPLQHLLWMPAQAQRTAPPLVV